MRPTASRTIKRTAAGVIALAMACGACSGKIDTTPNRASAAGGDTALESPDGGVDTVVEPNGPGDGTSTGSPDASVDSGDAARPETPPDTGSSTADGTDTSEMDSNAEPGAPPDPLSVDASNPFIYLDDQPNDGLFGELALAMANSETIDLRGYIHSYPREDWLDEEKYKNRKESYIHHHETTRQKALDSGFDNLPPAERGAYEHHEKPDSGDIEDTEVIGSEGTDRIVREARAASPDNPVVVACGGDVVTIADAYLKDPSIVDSLVVYWKEQVDDIQPDDQGYNFNNSEWSAYIVLKKIATVLDSPEGSAKVLKSEVENRVPQPLRDYMLSKRHHKFDNPLGDGDYHGGDDRSIILAAYPETRLETRSMTVDGLQDADWDGIGRVYPSISEASGDTKLKHVTKIKDNTQYWWDSW